MLVLPPRTIRQILWLTSAVCLLGAIAILFWPNKHAAEDLSSTNSQNETAHNSDPTSKSNTHATSTSINAKQWVSQLQRPLFDPPPPPKVAPPPPPPLRIQLVGTVISGDRYTAMIQTPRDGTKLMRVGEVVQDAEILAIEADRITVQYHGQQRVLEKQSG